MLGAINHTGPWTQPLNQDLHVTLDREACVPFSHYVSLKRTPMSSRLKFPRFQELPAELRLHILAYCDAPTLFQLLHVSSAVRAEAKRLFWSQPDVWYCVEGTWLVAGGWPGLTTTDLPFLASVEQVEVHFNHEMAIRDDWETRTCTGAPSVRTQSIEELAQGFWQTLQRLFPRAACVTVSESKARMAVDAPPDDLAAVVRMCPAGIRASAALVEEEELEGEADSPHVRLRRERCLWRWDGEVGGWERVGRRWVRRSVLPPPKPFCGPVGAFFRNNHQCTRYCMRSRAVRYLLLEARERHHFDGRYEPFACLHPGCRARFTRPGAWTVHAVETCHDQSEEPPTPPATFRAAFVQLEESLSRIRQRDVDGELESMRQAWGQEGSRERTYAERAFLRQLEQDPLYAHGGPASETSTWASYQALMRTE
ncbi:hypothetical protein K458DRAFT_323970 [Lentithecium fluviatile CBS 122367]|uniref:Uncharacterized protein n=1 Tax=Lentithecium fluviatile CBS 122367 TaxID=1168545 RepID=A0A6G1IBS3_9PLEO|nr:hypothetical protein K458DRAFT_323970 [Lentithecium fluviatile CBS 122367]